MFETLTNKLKSYPTQQSTVSRINRWQAADMCSALRLIGHDATVTCDPETFRECPCAVTHWKNKNPLNTLFPEDSNCTHSIIKAPYSLKTLEKMEKDIENDPEWNTWLEKKNETAIRNYDPELQS